jgi:adenylate cyclase
MDQGFPAESNRSYRRATLTTVGVDTDLEPLLKGLTGTMQAGRARLVRDLLSQGVPLDEIHRAVMDDRLVVLSLEMVLREMAPLTARDVAERTGAGVDRVQRIAERLGLPPVRDDEPAFDTTTCDAVTALELAADYGVSEEAIDQMLGTFGRHLWELASDAMILVGDDLAQPGDTEYELAQRYAIVARALVPAATPAVVSTFQAHLRARMAEISVTPDEVTRGSIRAVREVTVAFVDVVGFTGLGERVEAGELRSLAVRLANHATAVIERPTRLVKTVGDAILLMSRETAPLVNTLVRLLERWTRESDLPQVHTGVARGLSYVGGADVYGAPVNLASRLTDQAPPGGVWASRSVVDDDIGHRWTAQGTRAMEGASELVEVLELELV